MMVCFFAVFVVKGRFRLKNKEHARLVPIGVPEGEMVRGSPL